MNKYSMKGNFIFPDLIRDGKYNKYCITLINNEHVYIYTPMNQIDIIYRLTKNKHKKIFDELGLETIVLRKHIVKITEVK